MFGLVSFIAGYIVNKVTNFNLFNLISAFTLSFVFVSCLLCFVKYLFDGTIKVASEIEMLGVKVIGHEEAMFEEVAKVSTLNTLYTECKTLTKEEISKSNSREFVLVEKLKVSKRKDVIDLINYIISKDKKVTYCILVNDDNNKQHK